MLNNIAAVFVLFFCSFLLLGSDKNDDLNVEMDVYLSSLLLTHGSPAQKDDLEVLLKDPEYESKIMRICEENLEIVQSLSDTNINILISHYAFHANITPKSRELCKLCFLRAGALKDVDFLEKAMDSILFSPITLDLLLEIKDFFKEGLRQEVGERIATIQFAREIEENGLIEGLLKMRIDELDNFLSDRLLGYPKSKEAMLVSFYMNALDISSDETMTQERVGDALEKARILQDEIHAIQDFERMADFLKVFIASGKIKS